MIGVAYNLKVGLGGGHKKETWYQCLNLFFSQNWAKIYLHLMVRALFLGKTQLTGMG